MESKTIRKMLEEKGKEKKKQELQFTDHHWVEERRV